MYHPRVKPQDEAQEGVEKIAQILRRRIHAAGLSLHEVEERLGLEEGSLGALLSRGGDPTLAHVLEVMALLGESPAELFLEIYGVAQLRAARGDEPSDPHYPAAFRAIHRSTIRVLIWKLKEKGKISEEECGRLLAELDAELPPL